MVMTPAPFRPPRHFEKTQEIGFSGSAGPRVEDNPFQGDTTQSAQPISGSNPHRGYLSCSR